MSLYTRKRKQSSIIRDCSLVSFPLPYWTHEPYYGNIAPPFKHFMLLWSYSIASRRTTATTTATTAATTTTTTATASFLGIVIKDYM